MQIPFSKIELGEVYLNKDISAASIQEITKRLEHHGFEVIEDSSAQLIEKIKTILIQQIESENGTKNVSDVLSKKLLKDYSYLSKLFSQVESISIEKYFIQLKIEKAKEYLKYNELSLGEIAEKLHYSSLQHFSTQFKKITGITPRDFKSQTVVVRNTLDAIS